MHAKHAGDSRAHSVVGIVAAVLIAVALAVGTAGADAIVYDNGEVDPSLWGSVSEMGFGYGAFDDFVLSEGANTITGITWWGSYESETEDKESLEYDIREFRVSIYDRLPAGDQMDPWLPLYEVAPAPVTRSDTDMHMDSGERIFVYSTNFAAVELTPEKPYYLSIFSLDDAHWDPRWVWCGARPGTSWH